MCFKLSTYAEILAAAVNKQGINKADTV